MRLINYAFRINNNISVFQDKISVDKTEQFISNRRGFKMAKKLGSNDIEILWRWIRLSIPRYSSVLVCFSARSRPAQIFGYARVAKKRMQSTILLLRIYWLGRCVYEQVRAPRRQRIRSKEIERIGQTRRRQQHRRWLRWIKAANAWHSLSISLLSAISVC